MPVANVERFWCQRDGTYALDDNGFLRDPETRFLGAPTANPGVMRADDLQSSRCVALLGEPGAGKSTAAASAERLIPEGTPILRFDLASYGSEDRLVREVFQDPTLVAWAADAGELCLILDSLDEARARVPHLGAVIAESISKLPCGRLFLRIACRTADWPASLEQSLSQAFGVMTVVEILPLRRRDAATIAGEWCDPEAFLVEVQQASAGPLAARPLTLQLLARTFGETGTLPERGAALYAAGVRSLCEEQSVSRRDAGLHGVLSLGQRTAIARRIASATVFGGMSAVWTGPEVDTRGEDLSLEAMAGSTEPTSAGPVEVTREGILEASRTGLFTGRGDQRLGWAHATFADFLAAEWVCANHLTRAQARPLFLGPDGRCWPQTRLAAAWVVAIAPERFDFLTAADPAAFQGEVELPGDTLRAAVVDGLFAVANTLTTAPWERTYRVLRHSEIADQLRPRLRDTDADRRHLALELASECAVVELREELVAIAIDTTLETNDRVAAGWALTRLPDSHRTDALRPLAIDPNARVDDPLDELKGVALLASWPHAFSAAEIFTILKPARRDNFHGAYELFIDRFRSDITAVDIDAGLEWLGDLTAPSDDSRLGGLANRVLNLAATMPTDERVVDAFTRLVLTRADDYEGLLFQDFRGDERSDPLADPTLRRAVALAVIASEPTDMVLHRLTERGIYSLGVIRADDLRWLADVYRDGSPKAKGAVRSLFEWTFDMEVEDHRELVLNMPRDHPLHVDLVHGWVDPIILDSTTAGEMRSAWELVHGPMLPAEADHDDVNEQIQGLLDRFDAGEAIGFWYTTRLLTVAPGSTFFGAEFDPDLAATPRWSTLPDSLRERIVAAAERYLLTHSCEPQQWLDKPDILYYPAEAGYRAMLLLLREAPTRLDLLPKRVWLEWAPVFVGSTAAVNGAKWDDKLRLLEIAGRDAHDAMRSALLIRVEAAIAEGRRPSAENEARFLWNETVATTYMNLAGGAASSPREELVSTVAKCDFDRIRPTLLDWVADTVDSNRRRLAARLLLDYDLERSWAALEEALGADLTLAQQVLGEALTVRGYERVDALPASILADVYLWLYSRFPPSTDPQFDDVHTVGAREQIGHWRDRLLSGLRDRGTPDSVQAVRAIAAALPQERWLTRTLATAEAALRRNQWSPTSLPQLLRLAADHKTLLVNDEAGLCVAVIAALEAIQTRLVGATPESHYVWDTHSGRPKSEDEISDYLANQLTLFLIQRGAVVNREVQIRRNQPSGLGERTDLLVDAIPPVDSNAGRVSLPVEVKGAWNAELRTAMRDQLVDRYMKDASATHGIYIVAWPDLQSWTATTDNRRGAFAALDRAAIEAELVDQAAELDRQGFRVQVVHLNIPYRRPDSIQTAAGGHL